MVRFVVLLELGCCGAGFAFYEDEDFDGYFDVRESGVFLVGGLYGEGDSLRICMASASLGCS